MSAGRPVIGITTYVETARWGDWVDVRAALVPHSYVRSVETAGGIAVLVPPRLDADVAFAHEVLERLDGLILAGGADVDPARYGADRHPSVQEPRPDRDTLETSLATASRERGTPVLGICRGMQVMAVEAGGQLEQHVPDRVGDSVHNDVPGTYARHEVSTVDGSKVAGILGQGVQIMSYHHQAVLSHPGYLPTAWSEDGTLEAMEDAAAHFRLAVQWHPEVGSDPRLFEALVRAGLAWRADRN